MRSMTGYGRGSCQVGGRRMVVEARSVNHRFLELKLKLPFVDVVVEAQIMAAVRKRIDRGVVSVTMREEAGRHGGAVRANAELARAYLAEVEKLRVALNLEGMPSIEWLVGQPGVLQADESTVDGEELWTQVAPGVSDAIGQLVSAREREGESLMADLKARAVNVERLIEEVKKMAEVAPDAHRRRLAERLERLLQGEVDPQRVAQEVVVFADRVDVTEELTRLTTHLLELRRLFAETTPMGRRLDFLTQELNREVNTIGSKSQSAPIAQRVVEAKAELERIREQIQNVE